MEIRVLYDGNKKYKQHKLKKHGTDKISTISYRS